MPQSRVLEGHAEAQAIPVAGELVATARWPDTGLPADLPRKAVRHSLQLDE